MRNRWKRDVAGPELLHHDPEVCCSPHENVLPAFSNQVTVSMLLLEH